MSAIEEITEAPDLDQRLENLAEVDLKILDVLSTVKEIFAGYDRERQYARNKMEDLYKRYDKNVEDIHGGISEQLCYMEKMCVGAEHQGSTFNIQQQSELTKSRTAALRTELERIKQMASSYSTAAVTQSFLNPENANNSTSSTFLKKMIESFRISADEEKFIKSAFVNLEEDDEDGKSDTSDNNNDNNASMTEVKPEPKT